MEITIKLSSIAELEQLLNVKQEVTAPALDKPSKPDPTRMTPEKSPAYSVELLVRPEKFWLAVPIITDHLKLTTSEALWYINNTPVVLLAATFRKANSLYRALADVGCSVSISPYRVKGKLMLLEED